MPYFDFINVRMPCPTCGNEVSHFLSKCGPRRQMTIDPGDVHEFSGTCWKCGMWINYHRSFSNDPAFRAEPYSRSEVEALGFVLQPELEP